MKKVNANRTFILLLGIFLKVLMAYSQQFIDSVINKMKEDTFSRPSELIYLQTSKGIYETGEDLWFKAY